MRVNDTALGAGLLLFAVLLMLHVSLGWDWLLGNGFTGFPRAEPGRPGPALFPFVLGLLFALCGVILLVRGRALRTPLITLSAWTRDGGLLMNWGLVLLAVLAYIWLDEIIGFLPLASLLMTLIMLQLRVRWPVAVGSSIVCALFIHSLFVKFLLVPLPWGLLERLAW